MSDLEKLVIEWLRIDKNTTTLREIQQLWDSGQLAELEKRLKHRIEFGTAGLRGRMEAGFSRMNDVTVIQASQGLCDYVIHRIPDAKERGVVIGHDHRHHSDRWALLTAAAFIGRGMKVYLHRGLVHTPMVPFSLRRLKAACGVMITASHNPKNDNGYKVYWENGVQIIGPHDEGIAHSIEANLEPINWDADSVVLSPLCLDKTSEMRQAYFEELLKLRRVVPTELSSQIKFVNTSMHGVGHAFAVQAFEIFGLPMFTPTKEQQDPDPEFPTVKFPNPEEKGALDLAIRTADDCGATYVLAQDPDADRFSAAEKQPDGTWKGFSGDQIGTLFAAYVLQSHKDSGRPLNKMAMVASTVSSKMIGSIAKTEGFRFVESLTGFKYIGNTALTLEKEGFEVPFGYEEAIGFMLGSEIRDKDGISASVCFAQMVLSLRAEGLTAASYLEKLYHRYGYYQTSNSYFICSDPVIIDRIFARLRTFGDNNPAAGTQSRLLSYPRTLAGLKIAQVRDLTIGHEYESANSPSYLPTLPLSSGNMITFGASHEADQLILTIRTSGTEPKIKYYLEGSGRDRDLVQRLLRQAVDEIRREWMEAEKNGLTEP